MKITINTKKYDSLRGIYTYNEIQELIKNKYDIEISLAAISKCFTGKSTSYKAHNLICDVLKINFDEVYKFEKEGI